MAVYFLGTNKKIKLTYEHAMCFFDNEYNSEVYDLSKWVHSVLKDTAPFSFSAPKRRIDVHVHLFKKKELFFA